MRRTGALAPDAADSRLHRAKEWATKIDIVSVMSGEAAPPLEFPEHRAGE
jgi:hypothetical protein